MKSAIGIGALLMDGLGDTIRVSLTEDPEYEIDPCKRLASLGETAWTNVGVDNGWSGKAQGGRKDGPLQAWARLPGPTWVWRKCGVKKCGVG